MISGSIGVRERILRLQIASSLDEKWKMLEEGRESR